MGTVRGTAVVAVALGVGASCEDRIDLDPLDDAAPIESRTRPGPISGGTLRITSAGDAIASDPDRDLVHVVDLDAGTVRATIALEPGDEPGRVIEGDDGLVHVVLRGFGGVATIDPSAGSVLSRRWLCPDPRGIARDPADATLHVACADGALLQVDAASGEVLARTELEPDLRDVVVFDGAVFASVFRAAALVRADGERVTVPVQGGRPHVAWRTWTEPAAPDGGAAVMMLHQVASVEPVPVDLDASDVEAGSSPYGGGGSFCEPGITTSVLTVLRANDSVSMPITNAKLTVDAAMSPDGRWIALAMPGKPDDQASVEVVPIGESCLFQDDSVPEMIGKGQVTAVAYTPDGALVMQSREPARLMIVGDAPFGSVTVIELQGESRLDTGHEIFHRATESTLSCASCHPEGGDDGLVWNLPTPLHTPALDVGLAGTAPFHWNGELEDFGALVHEVHERRMGEMAQPGVRVYAFESWVTQLRATPPRAPDDAAAAGRKLFGELGCNSCHAGDATTNNETVAVGDLAAVQVPSLHGVALHPPYMHDGRSPTLADAVEEMITKSRPDAAFDDGDVASLVAYLETI
jgi:mono/diheme cytochrome c family protein